MRLSDTRRRESGFDSSYFKGLNAPVLVDIESFRLHFSSKRNIGRDRRHTRLARLTLRRSLGQRQ